MSMGPNSPAWLQTNTDGSPEKGSVQVVRMAGVMARAMPLRILKALVGKGDSSILNIYADRGLITAICEKGIKTMIPGRMAIVKREFQKTAQRYAKASAARVCRTMFYKWKH